MCLPADRLAAYGIPDPQILVTPLRIGAFLLHCLFRERRTRGNIGLIAPAAAGQQSDCDEHGDPEFRPRPRRHSNPPRNNASSADAAGSRLREDSGITAHTVTRRMCCPADLRFVRPGPAGVTGEPVRYRPARA